MMAFLAKIPPALVDAIGAALLHFITSDGRLVDRIRRIVELKKQGRPPVKTPSWALATVVILAAGTLVAACGRNSGEVYQGSPEELFIQALEQVKAGDFFRAKEIAEQSAEAGNLCSMELLAVLLAGDPFPSVSRPGAFRPGLPWLGQDEEAARAWADRLAAALRERAEAGDGDAMLWLAARFSSNWYFQGMWMDGKSDSLSQYWRDRALEVGHPIARRNHAVQLARDGRLDEADALFEELGREGDGYAFWSWAQIYMDTRRNRVDPDAHFAIASMAVEGELFGIHDWLGAELRALQLQAAEGNVDAIAYMAIVDSLDLVNRLAAVPEKQWPPNGPGLPPLCEAQEKLYELMRQQ